MGYWLTPLGACFKCGNIGSLVKNYPTLHLPPGLSPNCGQELEDWLHLFASPKLVSSPNFFLPGKSLGSSELSLVAKDWHFPGILVPENIIKTTTERPGLTGRIAGSSLSLLFTLRSHCPCFLLTLTNVFFSDLWDRHWWLVHLVPGHVFMRQLSSPAICCYSTKLALNSASPRMPGQFWAYNNFRCKGQTCCLLMIHIWELKN